MTNNPITVSGIADSIQQHFFEHGATISHADFHYVVGKLTALLDHIEEEVNGRKADARTLGDTVEEGEASWFNHGLNEAIAIIRSIKGEI